VFRRPKLPPPPVESLGIDDLEARPRPPLVTRENLARAATLGAAGAAWGAAVRLADSLPVDMGFVAFVLKAGFGVGFIVALVLLLLFRGFEVDRVALVAAVTLGGAWVGLALGPTVAPQITVGGTFTFQPSVPAGAEATAGDLECEWAAGRWRVGELRAAPIAGLATAHRLTIDLLRRTIRLTDDAGSTLLAVGNGAFEAPPDAPPRGPDDAAGTLDLVLLQVDPESTPEDPNEVRARFTWTCSAAPPG
jgi:MFS family permease